MTTLTTELLDDIVAAFNEHDAEKVDSFFHTEGELISASGGNGRGTLTKGRDAIREALKARFTASPDIQWMEGMSWIAANQAVTEFRVVATLPDGGKLDVLGATSGSFPEIKFSAKTPTTNSRSGGQALPTNEQTSYALWQPGSRVEKNARVGGFSSLARGLPAVHDGV